MRSSKRWPRRVDAPIGGAETGGTPGGRGEPKRTPGDALVGRQVQIWRLTENDKNLNPMDLPEDLMMPDVPTISGENAAKLQREEAAGLTLEEVLEQDGMLTRLGLQNRDKRALDRVCSKGKYQEKTT